MTGRSPGGAQAAAAGLVLHLSEMSSPAKSSPGRRLQFSNRVVDARRNIQASPKRAAHSPAARSQKSGAATAPIDLSTPPATPVGATPPTAVPKATLREVTPGGAGATYDLYVPPSLSAHTHTHPVYSKSPASFSLQKPLRRQLDWQGRAVHG